MNKVMVRRVLDAVMLFLLPLMMLYIVTGKGTHKAMGMTMFACFIVHHIINAGWIKGMFKGKYTPVRSVLTVVNLLLFVDILFLVTSGIVIGNKDIFRPLIPTLMGFFRQTHTAAGWWGFVLMSLHLGLNWASMKNAFKAVLSGGAKGAILKWLCFVLIALGAYEFIVWNVPKYLMLLSHFTAYDRSKAGVQLICEMISMVVFLGGVGYYTSQFLMNMGRKSPPRKPAAIK